MHVSVSLVGGLGNRMWQLQSAIGLAMRANGTVVVTHGDHSVLDEVFVVNTTAFPLRVVRRLPGYTHRHTFGDNPTATDLTPLRRDTYARGFMQSLQYLAPSTNSIGSGSSSSGSSTTTTSATTITTSHGTEELHCRRHMLLRSLWQFRSEHLAAARALLTAHHAWIGVHFRIFPPSHLEHADEGMPTDAEVQAAVDAALRHVTRRGGARDADDVCVMVFSNMPDEAVSRLSAPCLQAAPNVTFRLDPLAHLRPGMKASSRVEHWATHGGRDMAALTMCDALIITGGTFGFFAAALMHGVDKQPLEQPTPTGPSRAGASAAVWAPARSRLRDQFGPSWRRYGGHGRAAEHSALSEQPLEQPLEQPPAVLVQYGAPRTASTVQFQVLCAIAFLVHADAPGAVHCLMANRPLGALSPTALRPSDKYVIKSHDPHHLHLPARVPSSLTAWTFATLKDAGSANATLEEGGCDVHQHTPSTSHANLSSHLSSHLSRALHTRVVHVQLMEVLQQCGCAAVLAPYQSIFNLTDEQWAQLGEYMHYWCILRRCCGSQMSNGWLQRLRGTHVAAHDCEKHDLASVEQGLLRTYVFSRYGRSSSTIRSLSLSDDVLNGSYCVRTTEAVRSDRTVVFNHRFRTTSWIDYMTGGPFTPSSALFS